MCEFRCFAYPPGYISPSPAVEARDEAFFANHPHQDFLVRRIYEGEFRGGGLETEEELLSDGFVVVRRALDGKTERRPFMLMDGSPPTFESYGRALWQVWEIEEMGGEMICWEHAWLLAMVLERMFPSRSGQIS